MLSKSACHLPNRSPIFCGWISVDTQARFRYISTWKKWILITLPRRTPFHSTSWI